MRGWIVPIRDTHGSILGVAESFDEQRFTFGRNRHQHNLAVYGCLDETTGTPDQGFTQFHLRETLASFAAYHLPFGVMRIEVDQLGHFRAAYGREAETAILRVVAETIRKSLRPNDFLGRWAADQFWSSDGLHSGGSENKLRADPESCELRRTTVVGR